MLQTIILSSQSRSADNVWVNKYTQVRDRVFCLDRTGRIVQFGAKMKIKFAAAECKLAS